MLALFTTLSGIFSCKNDKCGPFPNRYKLVSMNGKSYQVTDTTTGNVQLAEIDSDTLNFDQYAIYLKFGIATYYAGTGFNWFSAAYACSPVEPTTDETIDGIRITSDKDFDPAHPAGSDLSDLFDVIPAYYHLSIYPSDRYDLQQFIATQPKAPDELTLLLKARPDHPDIFSFQVAYHQDGVEHHSFEYTTSPVGLR